MVENNEEKPESRKVVVKPKLKVTPQLKHVINVVHEVIVFRNGQLVYEKWLFKRSDFGCPECKRTDAVLFMRIDVLNNVIRSCPICGVSSEVNQRDKNGDPRAVLLQTKTVTPHEAKLVLKRCNVDKRFLKVEILRAFESRVSRPPSTKDLIGLEDVDTE